MAAKKSRKKKQPSRPLHGARISAQLREAEDLIARRQWEAAAALLQQMVHQHQSHIGVLELLGEVYANTHEMMNLWDVAEKLTRLDADEPVYWLNLAMASIANGLPFSCLHYADHFLTRWPGHEHGAQVREVRESAQAACDDILASENTTAGASAEDLMLFEQAQMAFNRGDMKRGEQIAQEAMRRLPEAVAPLNNLTLACMLQGQLDKAVNTARQVLEREPGNIHALSNLAQSLFRMGQLEAAQTVAQELRAQPLTDGILYAKGLEALATLGDDAGVIGLYQEFESTDDAKTFRMPMLHHLGAVSYARTGDLKRARAAWKKAQKLDSHFALARENLADLKLPVAERSGAWPFAINHWIPQNWLEALTRSADKGRRSEAAFVREIRRVLKTYPYFETVLPIILERGDPMGRQTALMIASMAELPMLRDFALSQNGTDQQRMEAAQRAVELGLLPRGNPVPLFIAGQQTELFLLSYEIYSEPQASKIPAKTQGLIEDTHAALLDGEPEKAEALAREALALVPDNPTLLNYLASSLTLQQRKAEAAAVVARTVEAHPDYFFGRTAMAQLCIADNRLDEAHEWLDPLAQRSRLHVSEFKALCMAQVELLVAEKQYEGAQSWLSFMEEVDPDDRNLSRLRLRLMAERLAGKKR